MDDLSWIAVKTRTTEARTLWAILGIAFVLRAGLAILYPGIAYPDEVYQYQEPAHRLLTGVGIVTWEWVWHVRSWLIPGLVAPVMALVRGLGGDPTVYAATMACLLSAASLPTVWVAYQWGREQGGSNGGIVAGAMAALSFQLIYFSGHLLMDTVAADLLIPALYQCRAYRRGAGWPAMAWGAALLGVVCYVRPQFVPPLLLPGIALLLAARRRGEMGLCLAWGLGPLLVLGGFDWITLGRPFQSVWLYSYVNLVKFPGDFGVEPFYWYFKKTLLTWTLGVVPVVWFCWKMRRSYGVELVTALLIVLMMSVIHHKESRFILAAHGILLIIAGVGMGFGAWYDRKTRRRVFAVVASIAMASLILSQFHAFAQVFGNGHAEVMLTRAISRDPQACGVYVMPREALLGTPGYSGMRDGVVITSDRFDTAQANLAHANYIITRQPASQTMAVPAAYAPLGCEHSGKSNKLCLYRRSGGCDETPGRVESTDQFPDSPVDNQ